MLSIHGIRIRESFSDTTRGQAAGLLAGAFSESTVIGTAGEAIQRLALPDAEKSALINNIPVAYAVTYLIGTASLVWFLPTIGPKLMGINLREEGARMQAAMQGAAERDSASSRRAGPSTSVRTA
jgi:putative transport protein